MDKIICLKITERLPSLVSKVLGKKIVQTNPVSYTASSQLEVSVVFYPLLIVQVFLLSPNGIQISQRS